MINKVTLLGHLGQNPEIRATKDGKEIASFSLATNENWKDKNTGEKQARTEWHRVIIYNSGLVNVVKQYIKKGSKLYIEGSLQTRDWTDNTGAKRYVTEIIVKNFNGTIKLLDSKDDGQNYSAPPAEKAPEPSSDDYLIEDEIPF